MSVQAQPPVRSWPMPLRWLWHATRWWLAIALLCLGVAGLHYAGMQSEFRRLAAVRSTEALRTRLGYDLQWGALLQSVEQFQDRYTGGRPLPRLPTSSSGVYQSILPGSTFGAGYDPLRVFLAFNDRKFLYAKVIVNDPPSRSVSAFYLFAEKVRRWALLGAALAAGVGLTLLPLSGDSRRQVAQFSLAMILLSSVALAADEKSVWRWKPPSTTAFAAGGGAVGTMICLVALVLPLRTKPGQSHACDVCGYDLTGNQSGVCPECGTATPLARRQARTAWTAPFAAALEATAISSETEQIDPDTETEIDGVELPEKPSMSAN